VRIADQVQAIRFPQLLMKRSLMHFLCLQLQLGSCSDMPTSCHTDDPYVAIIALMWLSECTGC